MKKNNNPIKNIILDFGGIIYQINHEKQRKTFAHLGIANFEELYSQVIQNPLFARFETGAVSNEEFIDELAKILPGNFTDAEILRAWNSILVGYFPEMVAFAKLLRKKYKLFLLSNTNAIHYDVYMPQFYSRYGYDFNELFEKTYWSFLIGMRKPTDEVYDFVLEDSKLTPQESLFIDDTPINVESAEKLGIMAIWQQPEQKLSDFFDEDLNLLFH